MLERATSGQPSAINRAAADLKARKRRKDRVANLAAYAVLIVIALIMLYPFYWTLITSLEPTGNIYQAKLLPSGVSLKNYVEVLTGTTVPFWRLILNSLIICTAGVTLTVTLAALAAYPLAKMRFPGRDLIFYAILVLMVLPNEAGLIVNYITTIKLGLLQQTNPVIDAIRQYAAVVLPSIASIVGLFLLRQAYLGVPVELIEAARIDGAKELTIWRRIMLPLALPTIVAFGILEFVAYWNSFLWARIMLPDKNLMPLSAGLLELSGTFSTNSRAVMAGAVITVLPILVIFAFGQRYFMKGIEGAVKG
ncbi:carbohydrate ABC transporter permease [Deinococcus metallilatus]|uniref:Carbohydrate ABC transporter permease n=1 Tax=Deinococcus metallilatus TaxID=1211322 RepID=A0AAJ5F911_9DEIO|nr:carbohydrate ABC transporter permease [Deinococcus metallilatus]MBB5294166.1 putative chitobiose transport system permease protein [Deinococcus metallilatus]QBY08947.1 carbohydrate ABC transporter permease [Deinococcus metallilatus]RXJ10091.1 carbohydrate ABC transporter permease [Deinococcus metallilatus]TLK27972.1 carbohydrate ABC transporter permease [Deinococcus metallilatus]GMA16497.1 sugar ABC transporter permease [Deinococcus metallilatus]